MKKKIVALSIFPSNCYFRNIYYHGGNVLRILGICKASLLGHYFKLQTHRIQK